MKLFDTEPRRDSTPAKHLESQFAFLNRVASPYWEAVRQQLDLWFTHLPKNEQADLRARFRDDNENQHTPAFWELFIHELFLRLGYSVEIHPDLEEMTTKPDFLVQKAEKSFYVEAVTVLDSSQQAIFSKKMSAIYDAINDRVNSPNFFVEVETVSDGKNAPPLKIIAKRVSEWLSTLDPDDIEIHAQEADRWNLPTLVLIFGDWTFFFRAIRKKRDRRGLRGPTVGLYGPAKAVWVDDHIALANSLREKSIKYGELDRPLVIALLYQRWTARDYHLLRALYDHAWEHPEMIRNGRIDPSWPNDAAGLWLTKAGPNNRISSAVLCGIQVAPFWVARTNLWLIHNPWAQAPLTAAMPFATTRFNLETGNRIDTVAQRTPADIFVLPDVWPPGEPFASQPDR